MANSTPPPPPPPPSERSPRDGSPMQEQRWARTAFLGLLIIAMFAFLFIPGAQSQPGTELSFPELLEKVEAGEVANAEFTNGDGKITGEFANGETFLSNGPTELDLEEKKIFENTDLTYNTPQDSVWGGLLFAFLPIALLIGFFWWMQRRAQGQMGGIMSIGRSKAKTYSTERPGTTFDDVAGYVGVKQEITEVVDFLKNPDRFAAIGARIPKGILLVGPPGTGKTLLARAVAGEAGVPFMSVTGSDFMEMFVGVGASRVRDLFESARKAGRAIIFIDEIDSIGRKRGAGLGGGHDEREQTLNQMLAEMDGFEPTEGIVMIAATNRPDILDPALLRPGRFDRQVTVPLPELEDRVKILQVHMKGKKISPEIDVNLIARGSPGMSGADLSNLVNEAALFAVRAGASMVDQRHFEQARDRIMMGQERESMVLTPDEKERIAYHEAGHAVAGLLTENGDPLHKVTIIPRGMALGVTMTLPERDRTLLGQNWLEDKLVMMLGGRMAEQLVFDELSSGASDDLARATSTARSMVSEWGMSDRIGPQGWRSSQGEVFLGGEMGRSRDYSDEMAQVIDEEVERVLREADERCRQLLTEARSGLDLVARQLLEHETIDGEEVIRLLGLSTPTTPSTSATDTLTTTQMSGTPLDELPES